MFTLALPVFPTGVENEKNIFATFRARADMRGASVKLTAADFYQVYVNGRFAAFGPARTALGYARVDVIDLSPLADGDDELVIAVLGHNCGSISLVKQPSFLCAEVTRGDEVILATGRDFTAHLPTCKLRKADRYSHQRHFMELWDMRQGNIATENAPEVTVSVTKNPPKFIARRAPYALYEDILHTEASSVGRLEFDEGKPYRSGAYSFRTKIDWGEFPFDEVAYHPFEWIQRQDQIKTADATALPLELSANEYAIFDLAHIEAGFISLKGEVTEEADVVVAFSEDGARDSFFFTDMNCQPCIEYQLPVGHAETLSFEPYTARYGIVAVRSGKLRLESFGVKTYVNNVRGIEIPKLGDPLLEKIYEASVRSYSHNAVDLYTDCPSRERAGWLCDSYFTGQTEYELFGTTYVEDAFLENFRIFENDGRFDEGMLPMCYPACHQGPDRQHAIPQWAMWYVLQVEQYINRRGHREDRELFRKTVYGMVNWLKRFENSDGLLEKLPYWNFIEWGIANDWTDDVSYPTNFLYAGVLDAVDAIFGDADCREKATRVRKMTVEQSFNGEYFHDHAVRTEDGKLELCPEASEAGQYYALLFGDLDLESGRFDRLLKLVTDTFRPDRGGARPEIAPVDAFIGAYLRVETLLKLEKYELLLQDVKGFFGGMAEDTGTLWEYRRRHGSRDHGFASFVIVGINRATEHLSK